MRGNARDVGAMVDGRRLGSMDYEIMLN